MLFLNMDILRQHCGMLYDQLISPWRKNSSTCYYRISLIKAKKILSEVSKILIDFEKK